MMMRRANRGYTLLELMVSAAILAVGLTALIRSFTAGTNTLRQNEKRAFGRFHSLALSVVECA